MTTALTIAPFEPQATPHADRIAAIWNAACGSALAITPRFVTANARPAEGVVQGGFVALRGDEAVGFALVSAALAAPNAPGGWIDALAVLPEQQRSGIGGALLDRAEGWLAERGSPRARLGGSLRPYVPGLPAELRTEPFFRRRGYEGERTEWDVARRLRDYTSPAFARAAGAETRPVRPAEVPALLEFMERAYPGRWAWECRQHIADGGASEEYMALWIGGRIEGFCQMTFEHSSRPIERFYLHGLPRPWGQAGPLGVSAEVRGRGYGGAIIDAALRHLQAAGVDGCVIDWTNLLALYAKFGFEPFRAYAVLSKGL